MDDSEIDEQRRFDSRERELTEALKRAIDAEVEALTWKETVERIESQRSQAEGLLLNLLAASQAFLSANAHPAYVEARKYMCEVGTLDKYERRLES